MQNKFFTPSNFVFIKIILLKADPENFHILLNTKKPEIVSIDGIPLDASFREKLLGVTIDSKLKFENYITKLCFKVSKKLNAICCIPSSMSLAN